MELFEKLKRIIVSDKSDLLCKGNLWEFSKDKSRRNIVSTSDSKSYKYIEYTVWDDKKKFCVAIGFNPANSDVESPDDTNERVRKELDNNGYGAYVLLNLFPQISADENTHHKDDEDEKFEKILPRLFDKIIESKTDVLIFWGRTAEVNNDIRKCLIKLQKNKKLYITVKKGTNNHYHPARVTIDIIQAKEDSIVTFASIK